MMTRKFLPIFLVLAALALVPFAAAQVQIKLLQPAGKGQPAPAAGKIKRTPGGDTINLVFLGSKQPVLMRFNILIDGKSVQVYWNDYIEKWFHYLDVDNDGLLSEAELKYAPSAQAMQQMMRQGVFFPGRGGVTVFLETLGKSAGEKASLADLQAYYRDLVPPVQIVPQVSNEAMFVEAGNALFRTLDLNKDGKLSKEEVLAANKTLHKLDLNDDEWITIQELTPNYAFNNNGLAFVAPRRVGNVPGPVNPQINDAFFHIRPGEMGISHVLLERYDRAKVKSLTQKDLGLDNAQFAKLDRNRDGSLNQWELSGWHERPADLKFNIRLGQKEGGLELETARKAFLPAVKETVGVYQVALEDSQINLQGTPPPQNGGGVAIVQSQNQAYLQLYRQADVKRRGFIDMKDVEGPQHAFLRQIFTILDRDHDGKLTLKEVQTYAELQAGAMDCFVTMSIADQGRALYQLVDLNRDGRLSQRELLTAWSRMEALDKEKKGYITPTDIARQFQVNVRKGANNNNNGFQNVVFVGGMNPMAVQPPRFPENTPDWFRKMDRNGDGDVSRAEFLGTREEFDRIDSDHDGLISAEEAMRFDVLTRKAK